ncbi:GNAT family N-acetyltransferase [Pseudomonas sp. App30]|uniref:GNAT family N-acetyltransferase n=1 Tax=Pseudomonas sp. App30 TaxID=3068990 RepID=UPI003A7FA79F
MNVRIELDTNPGEAERNAILQPLRAFNIANAGSTVPETFALLVRDEQTDAIIGGLYGKLFYRWMFIELLVVPEQTRGQGTGSRLMEMAEAHARAKDCVGIWLDTFSFQAPAFYQRHGYTEFGHIDDYPPTHTRHFFQKRLHP